MSLVREAKPRGLFQYFKEHNYSISNPYHGIYYIGERVLFPTQIIVTGELDSVSHIWLGALSEKMSKQDMLELFKSISKLSGKADREFADSVLEISIGANKQIMEELRGEENMCQALMEIMEPQITEKLDEAQREGRKEGIQGTIKILRNFNHQESEVKGTIMEQYGLTEDEAEEYLKI